jgi:hypothetical protein
MNTQNNLQNLRTMERTLEKIRARQLARLMAKLREINTPQITIEAVERGFNYFYMDIANLLTGTKESSNDKSKNK